MYSPENLPIPVNQSGNSFIKSSVVLKGLAAVFVGAGAGLGVLVSGWATVMTQFIFITSSLLHEGRPRMAGMWVCVTYQYMFMVWGQTLGQSGCQVMGPQSVPYRGIWDLLYVVSLVLM